MLNFQGKTIVVTGASSGIGAETARTLRFAGASVIGVIGVDRNEPSFTLDGFVKADLSGRSAWRCTRRWPRRPASKPAWPSWRTACA